MNVTRLLPVLCLAAVPLMAGGEYDSFHFGFRGGIVWSPDKSFGALGSQTPGTTTLAEDKMQLAPTVGIHASYSVVPGVLNIGILGDLVRPIHKEAGTSSNGVSQHLVRGELRFEFASRGNVNEGMHWFISPTYSWITTEHDTLGDLKEKKVGGAIGVVGMRFRERYKTYWEGAFYYLPKLSSGTKAGDLTLELRVGFLF